MPATALHTDIPIALYLHVPFCETKCPYCDFNTYAGIEPLMPGYAEALQREIGLWGRLTGRAPVGTVFFGGGTPSYLPADDIRAVMASVGDAFALDPNAETTLEANPDDLHDAKLAAWLECGFNRLSIGVQSFDDRHLAALGRRHDAAQASDAVKAARSAGFANFSIDLMYGLPDQTLVEWQATLEQALELEPEHLSTYCLTLEPGTPMHRRVELGQVADPDPDLAADMYEHIESVMETAGYRHYEISNWALPGRESRHNLTYWLNQPYLGVGPGAHSYLAGCRFANLKSPRDYIHRLTGCAPLHRNGSDATPAAVIAGVPVVDGVEVVDRKTAMAETLMLGLRLSAGVSHDAFAARFGATLRSVYGPTLDDLTNVGLLHTSNGAVTLTARGRLLGNEVFSRFV